MDNPLQTRTIDKQWSVSAQQVAPGHKVGLVLEPGNPSAYDPFLLLAEDWFAPGTFDVHPHRGIETVTYVISGHLGHYDNRFGEGELSPGDVQWMTAGRGVIHKEDPLPREEVHSLQLWVNLPKKDKMTTPRYQNLRAKDMPTRTEPGAQIRVFSGQSGDTIAQTENYVPVTMLEMTLTAGTSIREHVPTDYAGFFYVLSGEGAFGQEKTVGRQGDVLWMDAKEGSSIEDSSISGDVDIQAVEDLLVLLYCGRPLHEPVVAYGPFVMNTREEIKQAFEDYQAGRFGTE